MWKIVKLRPKTRQNQLEIVKFSCDLANSKFQNKKTRIKHVQTIYKQLKKYIRTLKDSSNKHVELLKVHNFVSGSKNLCTYVTYNLIIINSQSINFVYSCLDQHFFGFAIIKEIKYVYQQSNQQIQLKSQILLMKQNQVEQHKPEQQQEEKHTVDQQPIKQIQVEQKRASSNQQEHNVFYALLQEVGLKGKYQTFLIIFCSVLSFQAGFLSLGTPYYFAIAPYTNCPPPYEDASDCDSYVCSLPFEQRAQYLQPQINELRTLGNQFGDYHCQNSDFAELAKGMPFFGAIAGYFVTGILGDNVGRRFTTMVCLVTGILGYVIIILAPSLIVATVGLFVCGFGIQTCFNLGFYIVCEVLENNRRQRMAVLVQCFFCISGLFCVFIFYVIKDWKIIFIAFCLVPLIFCLVFNVFFLKETPQFLIKCNSVVNIRRSLRFIAKMNNKLENFDNNEKLSEQYIKRLKTEYLEQIRNEKKVALTYLDLFRYNSLRKISILISLIFGCTSFLYYAPIMLVDSFGFDFYINGVLINASQLLTYIVSYFTIGKIRRKCICIVFMVLSAIICLILIFIHTQEICTTDCFNPRVVFQLILVFSMRFCVSFQFQVLFIYVTQLFPVQIIAVAVGFNCIIAAIPTIFINEIINIASKIGFPVMALFCIVSVLDGCFIAPLSETYGGQPAEKILQFDCQSKQVKKMFVEIEMVSVTRPEDKIEDIADYI